MKLKKNTTPLRAALIYLFFSMVWILLSDTALHLLISPAPSPNHILTYAIKGSLFVLASASLLYLILHRDMNTLREQQKQIRYQAGLVEDVYDAIISTDMQFHIQSWNAAAERMYGWKASEVIGHVMREFVQNEYINTTREEIIKTAIEQGRWKGEVSQNHKSGGRFFVSTSLSLVKDEDGQPVGFVAVNHDIAEIKRAEAGLRESEERYHNLFNSMEEGMAINEAVLDENGEVVDYIILTVNQAFEKHTIYKTEQVLGKRATDVYQMSPEYIRDWWRSHSQIHGTAHTEMYHQPSKRWFYISTTQPRGNRFATIFTDITESKRADDALKASEEKYRDLVENSQSLICTHDLEGNLLSVNEAAVELSGYSRETLLQMNLNDMLAPNGEKQFAAYLNEIKTQGRAKGIMKVRLANGEFRIWAYNNTLRVEGVANPIVRGFARDITERKLAEDALQASELRFRALIEHGLDNISLLAADGTLLWESPAATHMLGYGYDQFKGRNIFELLHPEDLEQVQTQFAEILREPGNVVHGSFRLKHADDSWRWVEGIGTNLLREPSVQAIVINYRDVTERRQAEESRLQAEIQYRSLFEQGHDAVFILDLQGRHLSANQRASEMLGYTLQEIQNLSYLDTSAETLQSKQIMEKLIRGENIPPYERTFRRKDGSFVSVDINVELVRDENGQPLHIQSVVRDITRRIQAEEQLRLQSAALEAAANAIVITDHEGLIEWVNPSFNTLTGFDSSEAIGKNPRELTKSGMQDRAFYKALWDTILSGQVWHGELLNRRKDGSLYNEEITITPLLNQQGEISHFIAVKQDITERKRAEDALRESEDRLSKIMLAANDGMWDWDLTTNQVYFDLRYYTMAGYEVDEFPHRLEEFKNRIHPEDVNNVMSQAERHLKGEIDRFQVEFRFRKKNGDWLWVMGRGIIVEWDEKRAPLRFVGTHQDITQRKLAEEEIRNVNLYNRSLIEASLDPLVTIGLDGKITDVNTSTEQVTGYKRGELIGADFADYFTEPAKAKAGYQQAFLNGSVRDYPLEIRHHNGHITPVLYNATVYNDGNGNTAGVFAAARDITKRKQAEELIRQYTDELEMRVEERTAELIHANRAKDEFLANMSHELRTPLNGILGFSETLLEGIRGPLNERQEQAVEFIQSSGQHLLGLINDVLDVSKIESGKFELQPDDILVNDICRSSLNFIKQMAGKKHITVEYSSFPDTTTVHADGRRIKQVLVNLLNNAVKFTPENGSVKLEVRTDEDNSLIHFSVTDTGIGITPENQKKLFKPFMQVDSSLSRQYEGTGLGLSLVKKLVELHNGSVDVQSEPGKGSCFSFALPWNQNTQRSVEPDRQQSAHQQPKSQADAVSTVRGKILLAEDNEANMLIVKDYLEGFGFPVFVAQNGMEAIEKALEVFPDIILMDIQMPTVNGFEATRRLRTDPRFDSIPIIALTAFAMPGDRERCLEAGMNEYLSKPVKLKELKQMIEGFLDHPASE